MELGLQCAGHRRSLSKDAPRDRFDSDRPRRGTRGGGPEAPGRVVQPADSMLRRARSSLSGAGAACLAVIALPSDVR